MINGVVKLKIKEEFQPQRCEICHQKDYFDAITNHCSRCAKITPTLKADKKPYKLDREETLPFSYYVQRILKVVLAGLVTPLLGLIILKFTTAVLPMSLIAKDVFWADGLAVAMSVIISTLIMGLVVGTANLMKPNAVIVGALLGLCLSIPISLVFCAPKPIIIIYPIILVLFSGTLTGLIFGSFHISSNFDG